MGKESRRRRGRTSPGRSATPVENVSDPPSPYNPLLLYAALHGAMRQQLIDLIRAACPGGSGINAHLLGSIYGFDHGAAAVAWKNPVIILDDAALRSQGTIFNFSHAVNNTPKLVAQLSSDLAADRTIYLDPTPAQREVECTGISLTTSALLASCGGSLPTNVLGTCFATGSRVAVEARRRNSVTGELETLHVHPLVGSLVNRSYSLIPGDLFDNQHRQRLVEVLVEGSRNGRYVAISITISGHTFTLSAGPGGFELIDSLPNPSFTGHQSSGFRLRTTSLDALERALLANVAFRLNLRGESDIHARIVHNTFVATVFEGGDPDSAISPEQALQEIHRNIDNPPSLVPDRATVIPPQVPVSTVAQMDIDSPESSAVRCAPDTQLSQGPSQEVRSHNHGQSKGAATMGANPLLFSEGEGPAGLNTYDPNGKDPPIDWETGNYNATNKLIQECIEDLRAEIVRAGITKYLDGEEINFTFLRLVWHLRPDYEGPIAMLLFNYQTYEEARSLGDRHSWGARHTVSGDLISHTPRLTEMLLSPELFAGTIRGDIHVGPMPSYDPRCGTNEEPDTAKMAAYKKKKGAAYRPNQGVVTPRQQKILLRLTFAKLIRRVLEKCKGRIKLVVPKSALGEFLKGMGHSNVAEFHLEFPGVLAGVPPHTCVLYNKQFAANANFNTNCRNAQREWTKVRIAFSGNPNYPPCDLTSMMEDTDSEQYKAREAVQLEACALGGKNCANEYHRIGAKNEEDRTEEEADKYRSMRDRRVLGGTNFAIKYERLRALGDKRSPEEEEMFTKKLKGKVRGGEATRGVETKSGVAWSAEEDDLLKTLVSKMQSNSMTWVDMTKYFTGKNENILKHRWNFIRPDRSKKAWTKEEDAHLLDFASVPENKRGAKIKWEDCAKSLIGRTNIDCSQRYNGTLKKRKSDNEESEQTNSEGVGKADTQRVISKRDRSYTAESSKRQKSTGTTPPSLKVGQRVEGQFDGVWFPGTVTVVCDENDGCTMIQIEYDDGDSETTSFPNSNIRLVEEESLKVGQRVEGQFDGVWFPGTVTVVGDGAGENDGCTMIQIEYDDEDSETTPFPNGRIRLVYALDEGREVAEEVEETLAIENQTTSSSAKSPAKSSTKSVPTKKCSAKECSDDAYKSEPAACASSAAPTSPDLAGKRVKVRYYDAKPRFYAGRITEAIHPNDDWNARLINAWLGGEGNGRSLVRIKFDGGDEEIMPYPDKDIVED
ncbi:hypothetical protein THAOC_34170 [Thalassiosira oceanica]|uniref:Myb-like domain-containing protein n=1 Tax=Thalassiosira oceanica TaxID=159749 RepID=K0R5M0_THAOC|nr:hypothetical protein THAOC_34170 [Thalassiosira oceanica]|eukprot:EJK47134.1 hypothetical protein THAOC_34170 [Thalassiosira oceanica]